MAQWGKQQDAITHYYLMVMLSCFIYEFIYILCNATSKGSVKTVENNEKEVKLPFGNTHDIFLYWQWANIIREYSELQKEK